MVFQEVAASSKVEIVYYFAKNVLCFAVLVLFQHLFFQKLGELVEDAVMDKQKVTSDAQLPTVDKAVQGRLFCRKK